MHETLGDFLVVEKMKESRLSHGVPYFTFINNSAPYIELNL